MAASDSEQRNSRLVMTHVARRCHAMRHVYQRRETLRRRRQRRTTNNAAMSDICISSSRTTTVSSSSSPSPSSSVSQIVDTHCSLQCQTTRRTTTRFFVEDILRPDFGVRDATWRSNVRVDDTSPCSSLTDEQYSTSSLSSTSSAAAPTTSNDNCRAQLTTTRFTVATKTTQRKTAAVDGDSKSLNVDTTLPAWIFCTRYSDRPSSGKLHICQLYVYDTVLEFVNRCSAVQAATFHGHALSTS